MCDRSHKMMWACKYVKSILSCFWVYIKEGIKTKTWVLARLKKGQCLVLEGFDLASSSACTTTELSILLTSCLTAIKNHVIKYCTTVYERNGKNLFWSIKNSGEILNKLKSRGFLASGLSTYDFSTLYITWPHNLIKEKLTELIEQTFNREGSLYLACNDKNAFFTSEEPKRYKLWSCH